MKKNILLLTLCVCTLSTITGCKKISLGSSSAEKIATNESTVAPTTNTPSGSPEATEKTSTKEDATASATATNEVSKETTTNKTTDSKSQTSKNTSNANTTVFKDFKETQEYVVKTTGTYTFYCNPSDGKATWSIYVLDEKFDDALRYLTSAYTPVLTANKKAQTYNLKQGQYVYCSCSVNSLNFDGEDGSFSCPLAIKLN